MHRPGMRFGIVPVPPTVTKSGFDTTVDGKTNSEAITDADGDGVGSGVAVSQNLQKDGLVISSSQHGEEDRYLKVAQQQLNMESECSSLSLRKAPTDSVPVSDQSDKQQSCSQDDCPFCNRPKRLLFCESCTHTFEGRVRTQCVDHPYCIHLMDSSCCPACLSESLSEFQRAPLPRQLYRPN